MTGIATFLAATLGGLGGNLAAGTLRAGLPRRIASAACLLWIAGWIAVAPSTTPRDEELFYLASILIGCFLVAVAVVLPRVVTVPGAGSLGRQSCVSVPERLVRPKSLTLPGVAFAAPGGIGLLFGNEVLVLAFAITAAVTLIVLFLFR